MKEPKVIACLDHGAPEWWTSYSYFMCELPESHLGPHRMTIEWSDNEPGPDV